MSAFDTVFGAVTAVAQQISIAMEIPDSYIAAYSDFTWSIFGKYATLFEEQVNFVVPSFVPMINEINEKYSIPTRTPLPFMARPIDAIFAIVCYLVALSALFVVAKVLGKHNYRFLGLIHNFFLFAISLYMGVAIAATALASGFPRLWNNPIADPITDDNGWRLCKLGWVFLISKLPEFGDTFLMVLKHNHHQITFLHLYHHSSIFLWTFCILAGGCGGDIYWPSMVNSWVHVFMYGYYAGTLAFRDGPIRRALNSIKFIITKGQITQFVANMAQAFYSFSQPVLHYQVYMYVIQTTYMLSMVVLFSNFLLRNRSNPDRRNRNARAPTTAAKQHATTTAAAAEAAIVNSSVVSPLALSPAPLDVQHVAKRAASFNAMPSPSCSSSPGISPSLSRDETISSIPTPTSVSLLNGNEQ